MGVIAHATETAAANTIGMTRTAPAHEAKQKHGACGRPETSLMKFSRREGTWRESFAGNGSFVTSIH
jgi:hypothetical protein